jgi:hypothetical protein
MDDEVGVQPERLAEAASALENLRDVLNTYVPVIVNTMEGYWAGGVGQPISLAALRQAEARSAQDAADMRSRADLAQAWMDSPVNIDVVTGGVAYIPWDGTALATADASLQAQDLAAADKSGDLAEIQAVEQDIQDHMDEGAAGLGFLAAFYNQAAPQVAGLAATLYARDGTLKQPLSAGDQRILSTFAEGLAAVMKNGTGDLALTPKSMSALTSAPDMWSVAMLVKYSPDVGAYGTGLAGQEFLRAVSDATVQISPHVIVPADDPDVPALRAAWAWASKRPVYLSGSAGDTEFTRWHEIATVSPYSYLFKGQLYSEFGSPMPDTRIGGAFNENEKVLISSAGLGAVIFFNDPQSLIGAKPAYVERLVPDGWTGPQPLRSGGGWRYYGRSGSVMYEEGNPASQSLGQPDSVLHQGPYFKISENGYVYRIAAEGNPALADPNAATISIKAPDGSKTYVYEKAPTDDPGDGDGEAGGDPEAGGGDLGGEAGGAPVDG